MDERKGHPPRLQAWDYSTPAAYFVTFKVEGRRPVLGTLSEGKVHLSDAGIVVGRCWRRLPELYPVRLDAIVIMPDHVHSVLVLNGAEASSAHDQRPGFKPLMAESSAVLGKVVRGWKAASTLQIRRMGLADFAWQSRYYEHVIRTRRQLDRVRAYIAANPCRQRS